MATYVILIYGDEQQWDARTEEQERALGEGHAAFVAAADGAVVAGVELGATSTATSIRTGPSGLVITDGPFVETREVVGGLYVVEAPDLDAAIELASLLPEVRDPHSGVEVRPVVSG